MLAAVKAAAFAAVMLATWVFLTAIGAIAFYWWARVGGILWEFRMEGKL